jgi:hypothetical protein
MEKILIRKLSHVFHNKQISVAVRIVLTALFFFIINKSISQADILSLSTAIKPQLLFVVFMLGVSGFYCQVIRWKYILKSRNLPFGGNIPLKTMLWGNFLGFLTPGRIGELLRGVSIDPSRKTDSVVAVVIDRIIAIFIVTFSGIICIIMQAVFLKKPLNRAEVICLGVLILITGAGTLVFKLNWFKSMKPIQKGISILLALKNVLTFRIALVSIFAHFFLILQTVILLRMLGATGWFTNCIVAGQAYMQMLFLPFSIANVGVREYSFGLYLAYLGQHSQGYKVEVIAFGVSNFILFINIILPALAGLLWFFFDRNSSSTLPEKKDNSSRNQVQKGQDSSYEISPR